MVPSTLFIFSWTRLEIQPSLRTWTNEEISSYTVCSCTGSNPFGRWHAFVRDVILFKVIQTKYPKRLALEELCV